MYHTSAKLTFGGGEKYLGVQKAPVGAKKLQGRQKASGDQEANKKNRKNSGDLFFFFNFRRQGQSIFWPY